MKCSLCGCQFQEENGEAACKGCPLSKGCSMVRCPNCGYEMPLEPKLIKILRALKRRGDGTRGKS